VFGSDTNALEGALLNFARKEVMRLFDQIGWDLSTIPMDLQVKICPRMTPDIEIMVSLEIKGTEECYYCKTQISQVSLLAAEQSRIAMMYDMATSQALKSTVEAFLQHRGTTYNKERERFCKSRHEIMMKQPPQLPTQFPIKVDPNLPPGTAMMVNPGQKTYVFKFEEPTPPEPKTLRESSRQREKKSKW